MEVIFAILLQRRNWEDIVRDGWWGRLYGDGQVAKEVRGRVLHTRMYVAYVWFCGYRQRHADKVVER